MKIRELGVILVLYNPQAWIEKAIAPLLSELDTTDRIYCIDNGSTEFTLPEEMLSKQNITIIKLKENVGFGKANNIGMRHALQDGCEYFLLVNQDAWIPRKSIKILIDALEGREKYVAVSPIHLFNDKEVDKYHLKTVQRSSSKLLNDLLVNNELRGMYEISYTNAALWLLSKDCLRIVGGFDPLFFHYGEDVDYCKRIRRLGLKFGLCPQAVGFHYRNQKSDNQIRNDMKEYNDQLLFLKSKSQSFIFTSFALTLKNVKNTIKGVIKRKDNIIQIWRSFFILIKNRDKINKYASEKGESSYLFIDFQK